MAATVEHVWSGDLRTFSLMFWSDESDIAAIAAADGDHGVGWLNLRHVTPRVGRLATMWVTHAAARRAPWDVMYAHELAELAALFSDAQEESAEPE